MAESWKNVFRRKDQALEVSIMEQAHIITPQTLQKAPQDGTGFFYATEKFDQNKQEWRLVSTQELRHTQHDLSNHQFLFEDQVSRETAQRVIDRWNEVHPTIWRYRLLSEEEVKKDANAIQSGERIRRRC